MRSTLPCFVPLKNGFNTVLWWCLHTTLPKIGGAAHKNCDVDGTCKRSLSVHDKTEFKLQTSPLLIGGWKKIRMRF